MYTSRNRPSYPCLTSECTRTTRSGRRLCVDHRPMPSMYREGNTIFIGQEPLNPEQALAVAHRIAELLAGEQ
ncbi:hypothetical protein RR21198_1386 [Rhodococcus rhodochrous ATCC 21198]|nr:hypothetical protein RR21198_1386 [Rhodococcus rhodochrous ATCC 21198]